MSDGEGMERNWGDTDPLVPLLRWCTKQHRLTALNFRFLYKNDYGRMNSGE